MSIKTRNVSLRFDVLLSYIFVELAYMLHSPLIKKEKKKILMVNRSCQLSKNVCEMMNARRSSYTCASVGNNAHFTIIFLQTDVTINVTFTMSVIKQ
jgi:hypothetical protein